MLWNVRIPWRAAPSAWLIAAVVLGHASPASAASPFDAWASSRRRMVDDEIVSAGVRDSRVVAAMLAVPRHEFVTPDQREFAYFDMCLPIGLGQTISPPYMVASMTEKLAPRPTDKILEIGTGSGYQAAVLSGLVKDVYTVEIVGTLGRRAAATLRRLGYLNVHPRIGDGYQGWPQHAPYDKIIVTCSPEKIPEPLVAQLKEGGRLAIPVGQRYQQILYLFKKVDGKLVVESREPTMFVPMTGVAEEKREMKSDSARPNLVNGGFERELEGAQGLPAGWYYVRQAQIASDPDTPEGTACLGFSNADVGRSAQALQAVGIDGEQVTDLEIGYSVRLENVVPGSSPEQAANLNITFFDADRTPIGQGEMPAGQGSAPWTRRHLRLKVPRSARLAVVAIGLFGATGQARFDQVELHPLIKPSSRLSRVGR